MPFFEYVLVALMGAAGHSGVAPITTLGPEAIAQPNGGALIAEQETPKKDHSRHKTMLKRRHNKHRRHRGPNTPKKDISK